MRNGGPAVPGVRRTSTSSKIPLMRAAIAASSRRARARAAVGTGAAHADEAARAALEALGCGNAARP
jgi:6,7-dimethyl-8-ribityllumazine synthase